MSVKKEIESIAKRRSRRVPEPVAVKLTLRYRFGDEPGDTVTVMNDRAIPMVDSVFKNRERILRAFALTLVRAGVMQPKVLREMLPALGLLRGRRKSGNKNET